MQLGLKIANHLLPLPALRSYQKIHRQITRNSLSGLHKEVLDFHDPRADLTIVFPPSLDWSEQLFQRPQQMAAALAKQGAQVLYFQHREHWETRATREIQPGLVLCNMPVEAFWLLPDHRLFSYAMTWNCRSALAPNIKGIIYDYVDELKVFPGNQRRLASDHRVFTQQSRIVLATSERLLNEIKSSRPDALLCPNGVDYEHFSKARNPFPEPPEDLKSLVADGKPLAGYVGALARWFDYPLLEATARARPDWRFILIGPDHDQTLPKDLLALPNVQWLGARPYQELPNYLHFFSSVLIPFQLNPITHATSPLKLYEYIAAGKAVISTPIYEATRTPGVLLAHDTGEFIAQLDRARSLSLDSDYLAQSDELARQNTWERRAKLVIEALNRPAGGSLASPGIISP